MVSDNEEVIDVISKYGLENGHNPLECTALNVEDERFQDSTVEEIIENRLNNC